MRAVDDSHAFVVVLALVVSHWVLDFITHTPDMPLYPGGPKFGLGLWNSIAGTMAIEAAMFAAGVWIYTQVTRPRDRIGRWAFVGDYCVSGVRVSCERGCPAAAFGHRSMADGAGAQCRDAVARVVGGQAPRDWVIDDWAM